jgi:hypothetical protein
LAYVSNGNKMTNSCFYLLPNYANIQDILFALTLLKGRLGKMNPNRIILLVLALTALSLLIVSCAGAPKSDEELVRQLADKYLSAVKEGNVYKAQKYMAPEETQSVTYTRGSYISDVTRLYARWDYEISKVSIMDEYATVDYFLVTKGKISLSGGADEKMAHLSLYAVKIDGEWKITQKANPKGSE